MIRILFLAASPIDLQHLRIRRERNAIQRALDSAAYGKHFVLIEAFDVNADELQELLFRHQPHIVHFSGHGEVEGKLYLKDDNGLHQPVSPQALGNLLSQFNHTIQLVVLNACYSAVQADAIASAINFVVGMTEAITDTAAVSFAEAFYRAAANGTTLATMFEIACNHLDLKNLEEAHKPYLHQRNDLQQIRFIDLAISTRGEQTATNIPKLVTSSGSLITGNVKTGRDFIGRDQIIINLVQGMADLPTHYDGPVRNFLSYYLGSTTSPAPFGGRDNDLARLDQWLAEPQMASYLLLAAPAGRGKSALLAHWVADLMRREAVHIVFFPISIRFSTNRENVVFSALAARLARIYGETLTPAIDAQQYRGVVSDYLQRTPPGGKHLLVVLDGLDEAAGWEAGADLFPLQPPENLRVVVAARLRANDATGEGWLTQLGWENGRGVQFVLPTLDRDSVADVLVKMGNPLDVIATKIDVVTRLHELSEGDPLLVRLYVEALLPHGVQMATFTPEDLLLLKPGLKAFFDRWFEEQKKLWSATGLTTAVRDNAVNSLLNLCALAKGPLSRDDLLALASNELPNGATIDWAAVTLNRFIIGDGSVENGYTFGHPRFGYYFAERLPSHERKHWHDRFLAYGRQLLTDLENKIVEPKDASPYAVRYYGAHLTDSKAIPAEFYALVCEGWLRAWEWIDGTPEGFLTDTRKSLEYAFIEGGPALGQVVRTSLCFASLTSISNNVSTQLLLACIKSGVFTPLLALVMSRAKTDPNERIKCLITVIPFLPLELRKGVIVEAIDGSYAIIDSRIRAYALASIAKCIDYNEVHFWIKVLHAAWEIHDEWSKSEALSNISAFFPVDIDSLWNDALKAAYSIKDDWKRSHTLSVIASRLPAHVCQPIITEALNSARKIDDTWRKSQILSSIAKQLPISERTPILAEALEAAQAVSADGKRAEALSSVAGQLPLSQRRQILDEAVSAALAIGEKLRRIEVLTTVAAQLPEEDRMSILDKALHLARSLRVNAGRSEALSIIADQLPPLVKIDVLRESLMLIYSIHDENERAEALRIVAIHIPESAIDLWDEVMRLCSTIQDTKKIISALTEVAEHLPPYAAKMWKEILIETQIIHDEAERAIALSSVSQYMPPEEELVMLKRALSIANSIADKEIRSNVLAIMSNYVSPSKQVSMFVKALRLITTISPAQNRAIALNKIIECIPNNSVDLLGKILKVEYFISEGNFRPTILFAVAKRLPSDAFSLWSIIIKATKSTRIKHKQNPYFIRHNLSTDLADSYGLPMLNYFIDEYNIRSAILNIVIERLSLDAVDLWDNLLNEVNRESNIQARISLLRRFAKRKGFIKDTIWLSTLRQVRKIRDRVVQSLILVTIAKQLPEELQEHLLTDALKVARRNKRGMERVMVTLNVAKYLPLSKRAVILDEVQIILDRLSDNEKLEIINNLKTLVSIETTLDSNCNSESLFTRVNYLHGDMLDVWNKIFKSTHFFFNDIEQEVELYKKSIPTLDEEATPLTKQINMIYPGDYVYSDFRVLAPIVSSWKERCKSHSDNEEVQIANVLHISANKGRKYLLAVIKDILPTVTQLGKERAVRETAQAILDTACWWP